ncbi:hypothetical protein T492DRAFT_847605 [Pavlovales sp. CCMP2436]|nr:hypothetical protein T492DRAFT_847605 [Pavlovales sp. CCMP2436]
MPAEWTLSGSNDGSQFQNVQSFAGPGWTLLSEIKSFALQPGSNESAMVVDLKLHTGWSVGRISLMSARPLIMGDTSGSPVSMLDTPVAWEYNIILSRGGQVVNTGLYRFAPPGVVTKLS